MLEETEVPPEPRSAEISITVSAAASRPHKRTTNNASARTLYCACDAKALVCLEPWSGTIMKRVELSGAPDAIFFNAERAHLYVAIGDPGLIDVVDTDEVKLIATVRTEGRAHTIGFDAERNKVYAFLPVTHRAAIYHDRG